VGSRLSLPQVLYAKYTITPNRYSKEPYNVKVTTTFATSLIALLVLATIAISITTWLLTIPNMARVKGIGVTAYEDLNCTIQIEYVEWGLLEPNETKTKETYIKSESNTDIMLSLSTENWSPINASDYITLSWNYEGTIITPENPMPIDLYLHVSHNVTGIDEFTFDIVIAAIG